MDQTADPRALGRYGERLASRYLVEHGFTILDRNWRCVRGELDIIAADAGNLVVCEVKTRTTELFGAPFEAVTWRKGQRLRLLAGMWVEARPELARGTAGLRIDVVSILRPTSGPARVLHLRGAV
jgi:putative endonuclease